MKKIPFNEKFFVLDTERVFYWAGLLAADGCLRDRICKFKKGGQAHIKEIQLDLIEEDMIALLYSDVNCVGRKIGVRHYQTLKGQASIYRLTLKSDLMFESLLRFGLTPKKSLTLQMPSWLEQHSLVRHFIRGYFDGDGSVWLQGNSKYIEFRGTVNFLNSINKIIKNNINQTTRAEVHVHSGTGSLKYSGNRLVNKVADFMYQDSTIFLKRKYEKLYT